jgi:hypothetical protein
MNGLRKIEPLPLPGIEIKEIVGTKPELKWVPPTSLLIDATYQRDLSDRSISLIKKTVANFAWNRMKPPIVVKVKGGLHIVDGQHTAIAAATLKIVEIPIFVVEAENIDERARAFVGHNTDRVIVSPFDIYRALVASGDPDACDVAAVCRRAKVRVRYICPSSAIDVGDTASIGTIRRMVKNRGVIKARQILEVLVAAKRAPITHAEMLAVENIVCVEMVGIDLSALSRIIRVDGDAGLAAAHAKAKIDRAPVWRTVMNRWLTRARRQS